MAYRRSWQRDFDRSIREHPDWPVVVSQGDSWFSYPHEKNVIDHLDEPRSGRDAPDRKGKPASQRDWSLLRLESTRDEILALYEDTRKKCFAAAEDADQRPRIETLEHVMRPLAPMVKFISRRPARVGLLRSSRS